MYIRHSGRSENVFDQIHRRSRILCLLFLLCLRARLTKRGCETFSLAWPLRSPLFFFPLCVQVLLRGVRGPAGGPGGGARRHQGGPVELLHVQPEGGVRPAGPAQRLALPPAALLRKEPRSRFCESCRAFFPTTKILFFFSPLFDLIFLLLFFSVSFLVCCHLLRKRQRFTRPSWRRRGSPSVSCRCLTASQQVR